MGRWCPPVFQVLHLQCLFFLFLMNHRTKSVFQTKFQRERVSIFLPNKVAKNSNIMSNRRQQQAEPWGQSPLVASLNGMNDKMNQKSCVLRAATAIFPEEERKHRLFSPFNFNFLCWSWPRLCNLQSPVQNKNAGAFVLKLLRSLRLWHIKPSAERCNYIDLTLMKQGLFLTD